MSNLKRHSSHRLGGSVVLILSLWLAVPVGAGELPPDRLAAWSEYVRLTEARIASELGSREGFLVQDFGHPAESVRDLEALGEGELVLESMETRRGDGDDIEVPGGMIHHWRGAVLIPGVTLDEVLADILYPDEAGSQQQDVLETRVLERGPNWLRIYLKLVRSKIVTATYNTVHRVEYVRHDATHASSRTVATYLRELADAGTPDEREKPQDEDRGFLWRLNSYWRYQEVAGGVIVECESLTLSRSIPFLIAPIIRPIVSGVAKESMDRTLKSMRERIGGKKTEIQILSGESTVAGLR